MKKFKHFIAVFFVAFILLFKVVGLHALSHNADNTDLHHCEVCHVTTIASFIPIIEAENAVIPQLECYITEQEVNGIAPCSVVKNNYLSNYLFTRPPPIVI